MSLESLVEEIRRRGEADLAGLTASRDAEATKTVADRDRRIEEVRLEGARATDAEVTRERAQRLAAAKLQARKLLYEAREKRLSSAMGETRKILQDYTLSAQYPAALKRMVTVATDTLGKGIGSRAGARMRPCSPASPGRTTTPTPQPISVGGLVGETPDGSRRLNLSFDGLLRLREDRVREILA